MAELKAIQTDDGIPIPQRKAVIRSDSKDVLGVVGNSYVPVQNHQAFEFLDAVVVDEDLRYHTAGALGKGERIWMLAKLPDTIRVKNSDDITEKYLLLSNSHDGSSALRVHFTPIRVVCANTLAIAARNGRGQGISIIHKGDLATKGQTGSGSARIGKEVLRRCRGTNPAAGSSLSQRASTGRVFSSSVPGLIRWRIHTHEECLTGMLRALRAGHWTRHSRNSPHDMDSSECCD